MKRPTINELSYRPDGQSGLNFALQPATNTTVEAGSKWQVGTGMASLSVFNTDTKNEIVVAASDNGRTSYQNAGRRAAAGSNWDGISNLRPPGAPNWRGRCWMRPTVKTPAMLFRAAIGSRGLHVIAPMPPLAGCRKGMVRWR